mmetsp:Transcript_12100/g.48713  ORF Transcript_12100/g.48713 Transcript_12100/m.48713 type:complete len:248 (-) Transcript_12100:30-773(-)
MMASTSTARKWRTRPFHSTATVALSSRRQFPVRASSRSSASTSGLRPSRICGSARSLSRLTATNRARPNRSKTGASASVPRTKSPAVTDAASSPRADPPARPRLCSRCGRSRAAARRSVTPSSSSSSRALSEETVSSCDAAMMIGRVVDDARGTSLRDPLCVVVNACVARHAATARCPRPSASVTAHRRRRRRVLEEEEEEEESAVAGFCCGGGPHRLGAGCCWSGRRRSPPKAVVGAISGGAALPF